MQPRPTGNYAKGDSLDWRDHIGLAHTVATKRISAIRRYNLEYHDVVAMLTTKVWWCLEPGNFDPARGYRPSTYIMRALILNFDSIIGELLGYRTRNWRGRHMQSASLDFHLSSDGFSRHDTVGVMDHGFGAVDDMIDLECVLYRSGLTDQEQAVLEDFANGKTHTEIGRERGFSRGTAATIRRQAMSKIEEEIEASI
jgi:hypothetical protein